MTLTSHSPARLWAYAAGSVGSGVFATVPSVILLFYLTEALQIAPVWAGSIIFVPKLVGIVLDPLIGSASDTLRTRWGRRFPFVVGGATVMCLSFVALFNPPHLGASATLLYAFAFYLLVSVGYSLFAVPYITVVSELRCSGADRTRLIGRRMVFLFFGTLAGAAAPPALVASLGGGSAGFGRMALVIAAVSATSMIAAAWSLRAIEPAAAHESAQPFAQRLVEPFRNRQFGAALGCYLLLMTASSATTSSLPYFVRDVLHRPLESVGTYLGVALGLAAVLASPWSRATARFGTRAVITSAVLLSASSSLVLFLSIERPELYLVAAVLFGAAASGVQVASFVLLAELAGAHLSPAVFTGAWTSMEKLGLALGPLAISLVVSTGRASSQSQPTSDAPLALAAVLIPISLLVAAMLVSIVMLRGRATVPALS